jgi:hypothetical protein
MRSPRQAVPVLDAEPRCSSFSTNLGNAPARLTSDCDPRAVCDAGWRHSARCPSGSGLQLAAKGSFPVAEHGLTTQSPSGLYIIVEGVSY